MSKRRTHSPEFNSKVAMEAISGSKILKIIQEISADNTVHPIQASQWTRKLLVGASERRVPLRGVNPEARLP